MRAKVLAIITFTLFEVLQAQTLDLKGRVVQANGTPIPGAVVVLKSKGDSTKTGADGSFALGGNVSLGQGRGPAFAYRLDPDFLAIELRTPLELRVEIIDGVGHVQGGLARRLGEGRHRIALAEAMPASGWNAGLSFVRLRLNGETFTHPFFRSGSRSVGTALAPPFRGTAAKQAAIADTLRIRKAGYQDFVKEITSYTAGNLGDLTLTSLTTPDGWVNLFNGKDLTGWVPLIHKSKVGENYMDTFRADSVNKVIRVAYDKYPNLDFSDRCGNLYYNKLLTNYRIRVTYRFLEPQAKNPVGWGHNNSGLMIFGIDPAKVTGDPEFPPLIEIQLLGSPSDPGGGGTTSPNYCEPNGITMSSHTADCGNNHTAKPPNAAGTWTTVEAEVHVNDVTKVYQWPDSTKPVFTMNGPMYNKQPVTGGFLSLQSESQPCEFKDILLKELPK